MSEPTAILAAMVDHSGAVERRIPAQRNTPVRDYTVMVRGPGKPWEQDTYRFYTDAQLDEAQRWAEEIGAAIIPLGAN